MQGDGGLARARTTGDHEAPGNGADRLVLLGLDGGDDVVHPPGAPARAPRAAHLPHHGEALGLRRGVVEHLVVEPDQAPAAGLEVAAAGDAHRLHCSRAVERLGDRRPPSRPRAG